MKFAHQTRIINLVIDLSLYSQLFRVCCDLDHILALVIVASSWWLYLATTMSVVCLHVIINSCMKQLILIKGLGLYLMSYRLVACTRQTNIKH